MAVKGRGTCLIPLENGIPCGRQIQEGEPGGTVLLGLSGAVHGHKRCADGWLQRKQAAEREKVREAMVQRVDQAGPGGPLGPPRDALLGGVPLAEQVAKEEAKKNELAAAAAAAGVRSVGDIPFDDDSPTNSAFDPATYERAVTETEKRSSWTPAEMEQLRAFQEKLKAERPKPVTLEDLDQRLRKIEAQLAVKETD